MRAICSLFYMRFECICMISATRILIKHRLNIGRSVLVCSCGCIIANDEATANGTFSGTTQFRLEPLESRQHK